MNDEEERAEWPQPPQPEPLALGWRGRYTRGRARRRPAPVPPVPFVVGATRSGTTLLRLMLDSHPELALPSETHFIPDVIRACRSADATPESIAELLVTHRRWGDFRLDPDELRERLRGLEELSGPEVVRAFFRLYAGGQGKPRWGDKTPGYVKRMRLIQRELPEARFIHLIRDGRDVALSVLKVAFGPQTVEAAAERWSERILAGRSHAPYLGHYLEIHFENLVLEPEQTLHEICEFIELDYDPAMLGYHERAGERLSEKARELPRRHGEVQSAEARMASHDKTREPPKPEMVYGWKQRMDPEDVRRYEVVAGELLETLGYELSAPLPEPARGSLRTRLRAPRRILGRARGSGDADLDAERAPIGFVVGMTRSGYELLAELLDAHPELAIARESEFVPRVAEAIRSEAISVERVLRLIVASGPLAEHGIAEDELRARLGELGELKAGPATRSFYAALGAARGTERAGDATAAYLQGMPRVQRALPEARFVHVVRDGRDIVAARPGEIEPGRIARMSERWVRRVERARADASRLDHYLEVRYEDLLADPEAKLGEVCEHLDLGFDAAMLEAPGRAATEERLGAPGRWRERLTIAEIAEYEDVAGALLPELGYELSAPTDR